MKVLFLVMSCNNPDFIKEEKVVLDTWAKKVLNNKNTELFFYRASADNNFHIIEDKHLLLIPSPDDRRNTHIKTLKCFEEIYNKFDFDFIIRTNTTNYLNIDGILNYLKYKDKNDNHIYLTCLSYLYDLDVFYGRGVFYLFSKKIIKDIIEAKNKYGFNYPSILKTDDIYIFTILRQYYKEQYIEIMNNIVILKMLWLNHQWLKNKPIKYNYEAFKDSVCYNIVDSNKRETHKEQIYTIHKYLNNEKRKLYPILENYDCICEKISNDWDIQYCHINELKKLYYTYKERHLFDKPIKKENKIQIKVNIDNKEDQGIKPIYIHRKNKTIML